MARASQDLYGSAGVLDRLGSSVRRSLSINLDLRLGLVFVSTSTGLELSVVVIVLLTRVVSETLGAEYGVDPVGVDDGEVDIVRFEGCGNLAWR